ncbi:MAG: peroxidase [Alphaproteobacteria bacterium]|nr:peroxidase [Alphaproteobacteria bacterium]MBU1551811.1 peroxidase [Alphaproteobacteria bacterium]MBU2335239.1 peroxidase [Alphaproteobacteria bacterium]MBU2391269.1 peroxidase [Alphaproteobacteria bacterium]
MRDVSLELNDIQGTVLNNRPMPYFGAYVAFRIEDAAAARTMLKRLIPRVTSCADWAAPTQDAWLNVAFTWEGLRRLGLARDILDAFPIEFRQGMAARSAFLGDVGRSDPSLWDFPHGNNGFHAGLLVMASTAEGRDGMLDLGRRALDGLDGIDVVAHLDVGVPPTMREHFGFVDGLSRPFIEGQGGEPLPGQGKPTKAGEFILGYENELGELARGPGPEALWRNGTYAAIRKIYQDVAAFRQYLRQAARDAAGQEKVAAKMMGRWRSGCPLALSPDVDDPSIVADPERNNAFAYYEDDLNGAKTPVGCHIRRVNPRDGLQDTMAYARLHQLLRRGAAYGPLLPEEVMEDDGQDRGIVLALINANPGRQFEFVQSQWVNDGDFVSQGLRSDPIVGRRDRSDDFAFPDKPVRRRLTGLPDFTATRGGEHVFLPSIRGLQWLADMQTGNA